MLHWKLFNIALIGALSSFILVGCSASREIIIDSESHQKQIQSDIDELYNKDNPPEIILLSLNDTIDRALQYNLDARVSAIETLIAQDNVSLAQFQGAPNTKISGTFTRRNNDAASSSRSILTGTESLEPSTSSDQARRLADIETQWNVIDAVIAYMDGNIAKNNTQIAQERLKKTKHNIEMDTINAYWRAYAIQQSEKNYIGLLKKGDALKSNIQKASAERLIPIEAANEQQQSILNQKKSITNLYEESAVAIIELKNLMAMPIEQKITLATNPEDVTDLYKKYNGLTTEDMIKIALLNRPELREVYLDYNSSIQNTEKELISTFPGLNFIYGRNYDSNSFLQDSAWTNFSAALTQTITDFITLPTRYRAAKNKEELEIQKRKALTAAIIAQVYLARLRLELAKTNYNYAKENEAIIKRQTFATVSKKSAGVSSGYDGYLAKSNAMQATIQKNNAFADLQRAHIDLYRTLGDSPHARLGAT